MSLTAYIKISDNDSIVTITCGGILDITNCKEFSEGIKQASLNAETITVDFRSTDFIDTQIVHDIARSAVAMLKRNKRLKVLAKKDSHPLRVFNISGFQEIMDIDIEGEK